MSAAAGADHMQNVSYQHEGIQDSFGSTVGESAQNPVRKKGMQILRNAAL